MLLQYLSEPSQSTYGLASLAICDVHQLKQGGSTILGHEPTATMTTRRSPPALGFHFSYYTAISMENLSKDSRNVMGRKETLALSQPLFQGGVGGLDLENKESGGCSLVARKRDQENVISDAF